LFWKRTRTKTELIDIEADDRRSTFRVRPHKKFPVYSRISGKEVRVTDLGAGGIAFVNIDFKEGSEYSAVIKLPDHAGEICVSLHIIKIDHHDICRCCFNEIDEDSINAIHKYVLEVQKEEIKEKKALPE
jgi:hypothetical protein